MFVNLGKHEAVRRRDVVGIFDLDKMPTGGTTKELLKAAEEAKISIRMGKVTPTPVSATSPTDGICPI